MRPRQTAPAIDEPPWLISFMESLGRADLSPATCRGYRYDLRHFLGWRATSQPEPLEVATLTEVDLVTYRHVTCRIGRPLDLSGYYEEQLTKDLIDHVSAKIRRIVIKLYDGEDLDRFLTGEKPFDFAKGQV